MDFLALVVIIVAFIIGATIIHSQQKRELRKKSSELRERSTELWALKRKYKPIEDVKKEISLRKEEAYSYVKAIKDLKSTYQTSIDQLNMVKKQVEAYDKENDIIESGLYKPFFTFDDSEAYREAMIKNSTIQKQLIADGKAIACSTEWLVAGSKKKGQDMVKKTMKLMLRAFNSECNALIAKAKWNNVKQLEERINKAFETVNALGADTNISLSQEFLRLKMESLHLAYEYEKKKYDEKEEQRLIKEQMREEERVHREIEQAARQAENEQKRYEQALEQARTEISNAEGSKHDKLLDKILFLEQRLKEAEEKREKALSMAQQTKAGHVYIISNIGSFGEDVYKIGMTRRLEPLDRVKELGDASVPFEFDVHGMIYSDNAPELENFLHRALDEKRVNLVNARKEFFKASLQDIEKVLAERNLEKVEITKLAEAREYRESVALRSKLRTEKQAPAFRSSIKPEMVN